MPTTEQNIAMVRRRLGHPLPDAPDDGVLLQLLLDQIAHHHSQLSNTPNHWSVETFVLPAASGVEDYVVTGASFGRPFLVHTIDPSDTYHVRREIPFSLLQDADRLYSGAQQSGSSGKHSAEEIVFYRRGGSNPSWWARLVPIPGASGDYQVWHEATYDYGSLSDRPGLQPFHHLLRVQAAIAALPHCEWRGVSPMSHVAAWDAKVKALSQSLLHDEGIFQRQFDQYRSQQSREGVSSKLLYGWESEGSLLGPEVGRIISGWGI